MVMRKEGLLENEKISEHAQEVSTELEFSVGQKVRSFKFVKYGNYEREFDHKK